MGCSSSMTELLEDSYHADARAAAKKLQDYATDPAYTEVDPVELLELIQKALWKLIDSSSGRQLKLDIYISVKASLDTLTSKFSLIMSRLSYLTEATLQFLRHGQQDPINKFDVALMKSSASVKTMFAPAGSGNTLNQYMNSSQHESEYGFYDQSDHKL